MGESLQPPVIFDDEDLEGINAEWFDVDEIEVQIIGVSDPNDPERYPAVFLQYNQNTLLLIPAKTVSQMTAWLDEAIYVRSLENNGEVSEY